MNIQATRKVRIENEDGTVHEIKSSGTYANAASSDLVLRKGDTVLVEPMNPQKLRHRGRLCTFEGYKEDRYGGQLRVRFVDNGRPGLIEPRDVIAPAKNAVPEEKQQAPVK